MRTASLKRLIAALAGAGAIVALAPAAAHAGVLSASPSQLSLGVPVGLSHTEGVAITNTGSEENITFSVEGPHAADWSANSSFCGVLADGEGCSISVRFQPTAPGTRVAWLRVFGNTGASTSVPLSGEAQGPAFEIEPGSEDFGATAVGGSEVRTFDVLNTGNVPTSTVPVSLVGDDADEFEIVSNGCASGSLAVAASCEVRVAYQPEDEGNSDAALRVARTGPPASDEAPLSGTGLPPAEASFTPAAGSTITFPATIPGQTATNGFVSLSNSGESDFTVTGVDVVGSGFDLAGGSCTVGQVVFTATSCAITPRFAPSGTGPKSATLRVTMQAAGLPASQGTIVREFHLAGLAAEPSHSLTPVGSHNFGSQTVGTTSASRIYTVQNTSPVPLQYGVLTTNLSSDFTITSSTCGTGGTLAAFDSCNIQVAFQPAGTGTRGGQLEVRRVYDNFGWAVGFQGIGVAAPTPGTLLADPSVFEFDTLYPGATADRDFTLSAGSNPVHIGDIDVTGGFFTQVPPSSGTECSEDSTLAVSQECTIGIRFTGPPSPGGSAGGTVRVENDGTVAPKLITLAGASAFPVLSLDAPEFDFGSVQPGSSSDTKTFTLTNYGQVATQPFVNAITPSGQGFTKVSDTCHNQALERFGSGTNTCEIQLRFDPTSTGAKSAELIIASGAISSPNTIQLSGTGTAPQANPDPPANPTPPATPRCKKGQKLKKGRCVKKKRKKR